MIPYVKQQTHGGNLNFKLFIQTQAQLTREPLSISFWRLVNSHLNPADIVSRSFLFNDFVKNDVRFYQNVGGHTLQLVINLILILVKKEKNVGLIQSITKTVMNVYKALLYSLF